MRELQRGDWLRTGSGSWVQIQHIETRTACQRVHNMGRFGVEVIRGSSFGFMSRQGR